MRLRTLAVVVLATALLLALGAAFGRRGSAPSSTVDRPQATDRLAADIARTQERLRRLPKDWTAWAALGTAYVERGRVTGDPTYYPKADGALRRSLEIKPEGNAAARTGLGGLANARHDFTAARDLARAALVDNPYLAAAYGVLTDAETQLGNAAAATDAVQRMLDLQPSVPALTRGAYDLEQRGRLDEAAALLDAALAAATEPTDVAYVRAQLAALAWHRGDLDRAAGHLDAGLRADPTNIELYQGRARVRMARGDTAGALADAESVTKRAPTASAFLDHAALLRVAGRDATDALRLARAAHELFTANGGTDDLTGAALALALGDPAEAVRLALAEWQRRTFADVADTLGWALHNAGRSAEALPYVRHATATGSRDATVAFHHGIIALATGDRATARTLLAQAVATNPYLPDTPVAKRALTDLGPS